MENIIEYKDIEQAYKRIRGYVKHTPLLSGEKLEKFTNCQVYLKPENLQLTGSFKLRGALNKILQLSDEEKAKGIVAASSGNHGQGVAYAAKKLGVRATIILPEDAPSVKIEGIKAFGADVILCGYTSAERFKKLEEVRQEKGYTLVHPFDDPQIMAGQGTIGCEIMEDMTDIDVVVVPMSGGGLISGISTAIKERMPQIKIIGVETEAVPRFSESRKAGKPVEVPIKNTIADGLKNSKPGKYTYPIIEKYVDEMCTVTDREIYNAMNKVLFETKLLIEPSASVGIAAAISGKLPDIKDKKVCFVLSGGNVDAKRLVEVVNV